MSIAMEVTGGGSTMDFSRQTTVREILHQRPRAVEVFEKDTGGDFWKFLDCPLEELGADLSLDSGELLRKVETLPATEEGADWRKGPLYPLVDRLMEDHRKYRGSDLPALERILNGTADSDLPEGFPLERLRRDFHAFKIDFNLHMNEEEEFLFPKVLRTEASVEHPGISSETFTGSVTAFTATMIHTPEMKVRDMLASLQDIAQSPGSPATKALDEIRSRLENLGKDITKHADWESDILLPRTLDLERILNYRAQQEFDQSNS